MIIKPSARAEIMVFSTNSGTISSQNGLNCYFKDYFHAIVSSISIETASYKHLEGCADYILCTH